MWKTVKLGDVCTITNGSTPLRKEKLYWEEGNVPWFTIDDFRLQGKNITYTQQNVTQAAVDDKKVRLVPANSVLLCCTASIGEAAIARVEMATNQQFNALTPKSAVLNSDYLYFVATTLTQTLLSLSGSTTINFISMGKLKEISIPLPSLAEQERIVAKLDAAFAEIDEAIEASEKTLSSVLIIHANFVSQAFQTLNAKPSKLDDVAKILNGFAFKSGDFITSEGANVVKITNVGIREFIETDDTQLPVEFAKNHSKVSVKEGDIVFALTRTIINGGLKVARIPAAYHGALLNQRVAAVSANPNLIDSHFLYLFLSSDIVKDYVIKNVNTLMQPNLSILDLKNLEIPVISLKEQYLLRKKIETFTLETSEIQITNKRKIKELLKLKAAILAQELQPQQSEVA